VSRIYFQEGSVRDLKLRGDYIYLCAGIDENGIFRVIDISDPAAPRVVGSYSRPGARGLDVVDSLAFVANGEEIGGINGMYVLNIRDPEKIALVDSLPTDYELERVHVRGDLAYAVDGDFYTIDISDPSDATLRSQFSPDIDHLPLDLDLRENDSLIYIADLCSIFPA
ncbi:MAG: hypothetical protein GY854_03985, partial [Deltaproteobacteria bacterium]|nr:hypothetical protein [Deltaproteobacteria bacterium]